MARMPWMMGEVDGKSPLVEAMEAMEATARVAVTAPTPEPQAMEPPAAAMAAAEVLDPSRDLQ